MALTIMGEHPLTKDDQGRLKYRIATLFVQTGTLVTLPGIHASQRFAYTAWLNEQRQARGERRLTPDEERNEWLQAVDLITETDSILIRPDPTNMPLAFEADRLLQEKGGISKRKIRFLYACQELVQSAIRKRGEYWRITPMPQSPEAIVRMIEDARIGIGGDRIYYYSMPTGTRYLTIQQLDTLAAMTDDDLLRHLREIGQYADKRNHLGYRELEFFATKGRLRGNPFGDIDWEHIDADEMRLRHRDFAERFRAEIPEHLRSDSVENLDWRNLMFSCLIGKKDDTISEHVLQGLSPEFFRQIRWLPGGRIEHGELTFDTVFAEAEQNPHDRDLHELCDPSVKGFICNYLREFGSLEYVNIGNLAPALRRHAWVGAHRAYIAEVKHRGAIKPVLRIVRLQKWGIREHIEVHKDLLQAIMEAEDYTEYILDRRLGCWQLGMPLPGQILTRRIAENYQGPALRYCGTRIWTTYFERDFIEGVATDKIPAECYRDERFALALATLLGQAAAPNMVVGRTTLEGDIVFDDGDEVLVTDDDDRPRKIIVADHAGTFNDCESPLSHFAAGYSHPVTSRLKLLCNAAAFTDAYTHALAERLDHLQCEYRTSRRTFDTLFKHCKQDVGSFAWRWRKVLTRLDQADVPALVESVRKHCLPGR